MATDRMMDFVQCSTRGLRLKRMHEFLRILKPSKQETILDVGGYPELWVHFGYTGKIVFLNLEDPKTYREIPPNCEYVQGNGCCLNFPDQSFDIVFSNSVIEHVGDYEDQKAFANGTSRVGKRYWIQTPNKNFPVEPHFNFPLFQFFPKRMRERIALFWPFSFPKRYRLDLKDFIRDTELLTIEKMQALYPDGKLWKERFFGFVKSIVVYRL